VPFLGNSWLHGFQIKKSICLNLHHLWNTFGFGAPGHPPFSKKEREKSRRFLAIPGKIGIRKSEL
jgi:hypothetical protein